MSKDAAALRATLDHPVVDADGHIVEAIPVLVEYLRKVAGGDVADRFAASSATFSSRSGPLLPHHEGAARPPGSPIPPWWALPTSARDRATGFLPRLFHERLDELGIDFAILYSSVGLTCLAHPDEAVRVGSCKALNTYLADMLDGLQDRMVATAVIPAHTPEEAISALDHAVVELGFRTILLNCCVPRPSREAIRNDPPTSPTRSCIPKRPSPRSRECRMFSTLNPPPSSTTLADTNDFSRQIETSTRDAPECLTTLVSASWMMR